MILSTPSLGHQVLQADMFFGPVGLAETSSAVHHDETKIFWYDSMVIKQISACYHRQQHQQKLDIW